jgi:DNA polymerase III subunit delta
MMKEIKEHIKTGSFKQYYLLYGSEEYLKKLYRDKLKAAICKDDEQMNYSYFEGKAADVLKIAEAAQTLPFFADYRLIVIKDSGLFKCQSELSEQIQQLPKSTIIIFAETEVDKRNRLFKLIRDHGLVSEMNGLDERNLKLFVASLLEQDGKKISENLAVYLLEKTGSDMVNICSEVEKIVCYSLDRSIITQEDIDAVVTTQINGKIFQMIDAIGNRQPGKALSLYYDLLSVREKPMSILYLIIRHFNILLQVKDLQSRGFASASISEMAGIPPFSVNKYAAQTKNFTIKRLQEALEFGTDIEEQIKTGRMLEKIGVEMLIVTFSKR